MKVVVVYKQKVRRLKANRRPWFLTEKLLGEASAEKLVSLTPEEFTLFRSKVLATPGVGEVAWKRFLEFLGIEELFVVKRKGEVK